MRPKCECGKIACYWYAPMIYKRMTFHEYLGHHAFCEDHAETDNWAEYHYVGYHKKDWRWLKRKETQEYLLSLNERLYVPYWDVSHVKEDGKRWYLGRYGGMHCLRGAKTLEDVQRLLDEGRYKGVLIKEGWYE